MPGMFVNSCAHLCHQDCRDDRCLTRRMLQIHDKDFQYKEDIALRSFKLGSR